MYQKLRKCCVCEKDFPVYSKTSCAKICDTCKPEYNRRKARKHYNKAISTGKVHQYRATMRERQAERMKDPKVRLLARAKARARAKNVECIITVNDILIPDVCPVLGTAFVPNTEYAMSIDAINPRKGYTPDNIQVISMKANAMKNSASKDELIKFAEWVLTKVAREPDVPEFTR